MLLIFNIYKNKIHIFKTQYFVEVIVIWCLRNIIWVIIWVTDLCVHKRSFVSRIVCWFLLQCRCIIMPTLKTITAIQFAIQMLSYDMTTCCRRAGLINLSFEAVAETQEAGMRGFILCCRLAYFQDSKRYGVLAVFSFSA